MAEGEVVLAHIDSSSLYRSGHMVNRWFGALSQQLETNVSAAAPYRAGELKAGIAHEMVRTGDHEITTVLWSEAEHTMYVLRGTRGPIMAKGLWAAGGNPDDAFIWLWGYENPVTKKFSRTHNPYKVRRRRVKVRRKGRWMRVRPAPHSFYPKPWFRVTVEGQEANNFLLKGWRATSIRHKAMRRIPTFVRNP
jgi:hypothetical protein